MSLLPRRGGDQAVNILASQLGRKLIGRFLLVGIVPLLIFSIPLYWQATSLLEAHALATLVTYTRLAKGQLVSTLERSRTHLERLAVSRGPRDGRPGDYPPFARLLVLDAQFAPAAGGAAPWPSLDEQRCRDLKAGKVILTQPFAFEESSSAAFIARMPAGGYLAGIMDPVELWNVTSAGNYGPQDTLIILDGDGRLLAASRALAPPLATLFTGLPTVPQASGSREFPRLGTVMWGFSEAWLQGAFSGERWKLLVTRNRDAVVELPYVLFQSLIVLLIVAFCAIILLSFREVRQLVTPVVRLAAATRAVAEGDWSRRVEPTGNDELAELAGSFNEMTRRLRETYEESLRLTREAMVGRLAAMVAHQVNNPLAAIKCKLTLLRDRTPGETAGFQMLLEQVDRIGGTVKALLGFARLRSGPGEPRRLGEIVRNVEALFRDSLAARGIELTVELEPAAAAAACTAEDPQEILVNLLENAREAFQAAAPGGDARGRVAIRGRLTAAGVELVVEDNGPGLGPDAERVFEPFYTTKTDGTGLGLAISRRACLAAGGGLTAANVPGGGARFTVVLPLAPNGSEEARR